MGFGIPVRTLDLGSAARYKTIPAAMTGGTDSMHAPFLIGRVTHRAQEIQQTAYDWIITI